MRKNKRFVFDTNVIISAFLFEQSNPGKALEKGFMKGEVLASAETIKELELVFPDRKFDKYLPLIVRKQLISDFEKNVMMIDVEEDIILCRDPKDNKFIALAIAGNASAIITGDKDLLIMNPFKDICILSPAEFLKPR